MLCCRVHHCNDDCRDAAQAASFEPELAMRTSRVAAMEATSFGIMCLGPASISGHGFSSGLVRQFSNSSRQHALQILHASDAGMLFAVLQDGN